MHLKFDAFKRRTFSGSILVFLGGSEPECLAALPATVLSQVVFRDLKPDNVLVTFKDRGRLLGAAKK